MRSGDTFMKLVNSSGFIKNEMLKRVYGKSDETLMVGSYVVDFDFSSGMVTLMNRAENGGTTVRRIEDFAADIKQ